MTHQSALYRGEVMHRRFRPFLLGFRSRIWTLLLDLDELPSLQSFLFRHNRAGLLSFHDRDHGPRDGSALKPWIEQQLDAAGLTYPRGAVRLIAMPRVCGFVFNPLAQWLCFDQDEQLRAVLYEVRNTFGESHSYLIPLAHPAKAGTAVQQSCDKAFHVSPFIDPVAHYRFRLRVPDDRLSLTINEWVPEGRQLLATLTGKRQTWSNAALAGQLFRFPLLTWKVVFSIHWQALKLWRKGARFHRRPLGNSAPVTLVTGPPPKAAE